MPTFVSPRVRNAVRRFNRSVLNSFRAYERGETTMESQRLVALRDEQGPSVSLCLPFAALTVDAGGQARPGSDPAAR